MTKIISEEAVINRNIWVEKIEKLKGVFATNSGLIEEELSIELENNGLDSLLNHLRLCGNIPESYGHDTSEEKQYSKYTDALLCFAYKSMGLKSIIISERADVADVEGFGKDFSFVADAKAFRISRTAKNQKDFKVQAMDKWKHGKKNAMVVSPIYQLPTRTSQIYEQAISRNVCVFSYSHLALLVRYANEVSKAKSESLLFEIFETIPALNPTKNSVDYWLAVNKTMLSHSKSISELWHEEKIAIKETIEIGKKEALIFLASERERMVNLSHKDALRELLKMSKLDSKIKAIEKINSNNLFDIK
jgi:hypothetical protein